MKRIVLLSVALMSVAGVRGAEFIDVSAPDKLFTIGARMGFNITNNTLGATLPNTSWDSSSWGSGFEIGAVADIAFRDWVAVQPGFFYQTRSHSFAMVYNGVNDIHLGHNLQYTFQIPILCSVRFNITDQVRWIVECGPYISFNLGHDDSGITVSIDPEIVDWPVDFTTHRRCVNFGGKLGAGILLRDRYWVGAHYQAGFTNLYTSETPLSGHPKTWSFTLGYNF